MKRRKMLLGLLVVVAVAVAQGAGVSPFKSGERVLFYGDSITHGGKYVFYLQLFENLRHPGSGVRLLNGGRSGGTAWDGLVNFDRELKASRPDRAFVMFGMNDIGRSNWNDLSCASLTSISTGEATAKRPLGSCEDTTSPLEEVRRNSLEAFRTRMGELADRFVSAGVKPVLVTPSPFDQYNVKAGANIAHCNEGLAAAAEIVGKMADGRNLELVDLHAPMTKLFSDSAEDFVFCRDRVHPGNEGHLYMAALVLEAMGVLPEVGGTTFDAGRNAEGARFDYVPKALPFPRIPEYETLEAFYPLTERLNREVIRVTGLQPGRYTLAFEGRPVGDYSADELAKGVNVALLDTPNQRRAQALVPVMRKLQSVVTQYRNVMLVIRMIEDAKVDPMDFAAADAWLDQWLDGQKTSVWYGGIKAWVDGYRAGRGRIAKTEAEIESLYGLMAAARPDPALVTVTRIATLSSAAAEWERRGRAETLEWFSAHQFGRTPIGRTPDETFGPTYVSFPELGLRIDVSCHLPEGASAEHPVPVFLFGDHIDISSTPDFRRGVYKGLPISEIMSRGYAFVRWNFNDVCPNASGYNKPGLWPIGVIAKLATGDASATNIVRQADSWGTIGAWAWGNSRVLDWIESRPELDAKKVAVVGHSRGGKTALWTAAQDMRFAMAVANGSGCGGAGLAHERVKHEGSERFKDILGTFPNWFCPAFTEWIGREAEVPHDSDDLIRLIAPRLVYVASGDKDTWACPASEKAAVDAARDIYRAYGAEERMGYHCHEGPHKLHAEDWAKFMDFADRHLKANR